MAQFAVRIYREGKAGYRGTIDGLGVVRGRSLAETVRAARTLLGQVLTGAFPDRLGIDPAGADLVVWFDIVLTRHQPRTAKEGALVQGTGCQGARPHSHPPDNRV